MKNTSCLYSAKQRSHTFYVDITLWIILHILALCVSEKNVFVKITIVNGKLKLYSWQRHNTAGDYKDLCYYYDEKVAHTGSILYSV